VVLGREQIMVAEPISLQNDSFPTETIQDEMIERIQSFPRIRYMGSKYKIVPYLTKIFLELPGQKVLDAFIGSGIVSYALKVAGKSVHSNDYMNFPVEIAKATVVNSNITLSQSEISQLLEEQPNRDQFILNTFHGLYFDDEDHAFLDNTWANLRNLDNPYKQALVKSALCLAAIKKQPRGVFTITDSRYNDGRKDLRLSMKEQFLNALEGYQSIIFDNGQVHSATNQDIFDCDTEFDVVYMDPPYMPKKDDNDYIKRYHFLEGLSVYWENQRIMEQTKTKKLEKRPTRFGRRPTIHNTFDDLFRKFADSTIVLSYSSNGIPSLEDMTKLLRKYKTSVELIKIPHRYSFGTHENVAEGSNLVDEYIFIGR